MINVFLHRNKQNLFSLKQRKTFYCCFMFSDSQTNSLISLIIPKKRSMTLTKSVIFLLIFSGFLLFFFYACTPKKGSVGTSTETSYVKNQISVLLQDNIPPEKLEKQFVQYELKSKGRSSKSEYLWVYAFNPTEINAVDLSNKLSNLDFVVKANPIEQKGVEVQSSTSGKGKKVKINQGN